MNFRDLNDVKEMGPNEPLVPERLSECSPGAKLVYLAVRAYDYPTTADISEAAGLSNSSVRRAVQELTERGELDTVKSISDGRTRRHKLIDPPPR